MRLDRFAWSHWIRKCLFYFGTMFRSRAQAAPDGAQLLQMTPRKNEKPLIFRMAQKIEFELFRDFFRPLEPFPPGVGSLLCPEGHIVLH